MTQVYTDGHIQDVVNEYIKTNIIHVHVKTNIQHKHAHEKKHTFTCRYVSCIHIQAYSHFKSNLVQGKIKRDGNIMNVSHNTQCSIDKQGCTQLHMQCTHLKHTHTHTHTHTHMKNSCIPISLQ